MRVKATMNPLRSGVFSWQVISHKLLRWLIPLFLAIGAFGSAILALSGYGLFQLISLGAVTLLLLAWAGYRTEDKNRLPMWLSLPYYFVMVNLYSLKGIIKALRGETHVAWSSARPGRE